MPTLAGLPGRLRRLLTETDHAAGGDGPAAGVSGTVLPESLAERFDGQGAFTGDDEEE